MAENENNWIKLNRSILDHWLWSSDETFSRGQAFIDLLLLAAYADHKAMSHGRMMYLKRGSLITSIRHLSERWHWSKDKTQRFLIDLETNETIKKVSDTKRTIITIVNYEKYQGLVTSNRTQNGHESDTERTQNGQTKERKEGKRNNYNIFHPPSVEDVKEYCDEKGYSIDPSQFVNFYESKGWMVGKNKMKDWKAAVRTWQGNHTTTSSDKKTRFNDFPQREYDMGELERDLLGRSSQVYQDEEDDSR